jgi:hypothetical protein
MMDDSQPLPSPPAVAVFEVVGRHRDDPRVLLLLGSDGGSYEQALPDGYPVPIAGPLGGEWVLDRPRSGRAGPPRRAA